MLVAPFSMPVLYQSAYGLGVQDGQNWIPTVPEIPLNASDVTITIATSAQGGDDANDGVTKPVATFQRAINIAKVRNARCPRILFTRGGTYTMGGTNIGTDFVNGFQVDATGPTTDPRPIWAASDNAINFIRTRAPDVRNITIKPTVAGKGAGLYYDSCTNITIDRVTIYGYCMGISINGMNNLQISITRCGMFYQDSTNTNDSSGIYMQGVPLGDTALIAGNKFVRCGLPLNLDPNDPTLARKHGLYGNESPYPPSGGEVHFYANECVDCASRGCGSRRDGVYEWNVFRSNGTAADINFGNCGAADGKGVLQDTVIFGAAPGTGAPFWGGGIEAASTNVIVQRVYAFGANPIQKNPLINIIWDSAPLNPPPGLNAGHGPMPATGVTATVNGICGVWSNAPVVVSNGRTATQSGIDVRLPTSPNEPLPSLEAFFGCTTSNLYKVMEARTGMVDGPTIVDWAKRSWAYMKNPLPAPAPPIPPVPAQPTIEMFVNGVEWSVQPPAGSR